MQLGLMPKVELNCGIVWKCSMWDCAIRNDAMWNCEIQNDAMWNCAIQNDAIWNCIIQNYAQWNCAIRNEAMRYCAKTELRDTDFNSNSIRNCAIRNLCNF